MGKVKTISLDDLDQLGIDDQGNLYWRGHPVQTQQTVKLQLMTNIAIIVGALSTFGLFMLNLSRVICL